MKRVAVFTATRAEFGLLSPVCRLIHQDDGLELLLLVSGTHLDPDRGMTVTEIEAQGLPVAVRIPLELAQDTPQAIGAAMGQALAGCARALADLRPDWLLLLGDRYETLAAASAAAVCRVPVAHMHGGEITLGAMDEAFRHAITKLSHLHLAATDDSRRRIIQLGEAPDRVLFVGSPGLETLRGMAFPERAEMAADLGLSPERPFFLVTFHPATLEPGRARAQMAALTTALDRFPDHDVVLTKAGADPEGLDINEMADAYGAGQPGRVLVAASLGQRRYLSAMRHCAAVVGNSSSGIIEAPGLGVPTVNVGRRQDGRERAASVIDCAADAESIAAALAKAVSPGFLRSIQGTRSPYDKPGTAEATVAALKACPAEVRKPFHDLPGAD